jgi:hypothetical protein
MDGTAGVFFATDGVVEDGFTERVFAARGLAVGIVEGCVSCGFAPSVSNGCPPFTTE